MRLGIVVRADDTGLGNQTYELVKMLNPTKILVIDSSTFHNKFVQHHEWYDKKKVIVSNGFPDNRKLLQFFQGIDAVLSCETFYSKHFIPLAKKKKIKTILQYNFEFLDYLSNNKLMLPDVLLAPSLWRFEEIQEKFGDQCIVTHLPPPTDPSLFKNAKNKNQKRTNRLLHIAGKPAIYDRNGTNSVIEMLQFSKADYELIIKSQKELKINTTDSRVKIIIGNEEKRQNLYAGYDAMILPRRYAGLCLPMNEALMSGLPVFMTNISPNNIILPKQWLVDSIFVKTFMTRIGIDLYEANPKRLAAMVDKYFYQEDLLEDKERAFGIGHEHFSPSVLKQKYIDLIKSLS